MSGGKKCAVASCPNKYFTTRNFPNTISYFRFPKDPELRKIWIEKCQRVQRFNPDSARICSEHFSAEDIEDRSIAKKMGFNWPTKLKRYVFPTRNLGSISPPSQHNLMEKHSQSPKAFSTITDDQKEGSMGIVCEPVGDGNYSKLGIKEIEEINEEEMDKDEVDYNELGILGSVFKSYDKLCVHSRKAGQLELLIGNMNHSFVMTIKRLDKMILIDQDSCGTPLSQTHPKIVLHNIYINTKQGIMKYDFHRSAPNEGAFSNECQPEPDKTESINNQINNEVGRPELQPTQRCSAQTVDTLKSIQVSLDNVDASLSKEKNKTDSNVEVRTMDVRLHSVKHLDSYLSSNGIKESEFYEEEKFLSDDDDEDEQEYDLNEISDDDQHHQINSDGSSDAENNSPLMETLDNIIVAQIEPDKFVYQCKICHARTLRINKLHRHIRKKHRNMDVIKKISSDIFKGEEGKETDINEEVELSKSASKRKEYLERFLNLLEDKAISIGPMSNLDENEISKDSENEILIGEDAFDAENPDEVHKCSFCDFTSGDLTGLYRHIGLNHAHNPNEHNKKGKLRTNCVFCPFKGSSRRSLMIHLRRNHRDSKPFECNHCQYKTKYKTSIDRHIQVIHDNKRFKCDQCDYLTTRKYVLKHHIMFKHQGVMPFKCTEPGCDYGALTNATLRAHLIKVHKSISPFSCTVSSCSYTAVTNFVLKSHMFTKHGIGDRSVVNQCPHCDKQFTEKGNLHKHISKKHLGQNKRFKCSECNFTASERHIVKTHISEVHLGQYRYSCEHCEFKCSVRSKLQTHLNIVHLGLRPYHCQFCDYKASQPVRLKRHIMEVHKREKPHHCTYCSFHTAQKCNLKAHLKSIHKVSDEHIKQVLLSCVDTSVDKSNEVVEEYEVEQEIVIAVPREEETVLPQPQDLAVEEQIVLTLPP